ncbi:fasciclin domain-containing protein [Viscerimonas tarda]
MKKIAIFICAMLLLVSCEDPNKGDIVPAVGEYPIATWLTLDGNKNYSKWADVLNQAGMYSTLNLSKSYTAFIPSNEAVETYLANHGYASVSALPKAEAELLVKYHTIAGTVYDQNTFSVGVLSDTTASGDRLSIEYRGSDIYVNGVAHVDNLDVKTTNGIIQGINQVLIPITATIWDIASAPEYSIIAELLDITGYKTLLSSIRIGGVKVNYTLFLTPNSAFVENGIHNASELIAAIGAADQNYTDPDNALNKYVSYRIFDQLWDLDQLSEFSGTSTSKNIETSASGELINVSARDNSLYINYRKATGKGISILVPNINTKNGIVQVINDPMFVIVPDLANVTWELTDYSDLADLFSDYRTPKEKDDVNRNIEVGKVNCYTWETAAFDVLNSSVRYGMYKKDSEGNKAMNHDALKLNLKLFGWIEMQSPTILRGNYTLKVRCLSAGSSNLTKSGKIAITVDGAYVGVEAATNGLTTSASLQTVVIGNVVFNTTTSHTLRILQTDNVEIVLDYIEFVPAD